MQTNKTEQSSGLINPPTAFLRRMSLDNSMFYMGSLMTFLARGSETDGRFAIMVYTSRPGNEPPPHIHLWEHEMYYILEGVVEYYVEDKVFIARAGDSVYLPLGKPHAFYFRSPSFQALLMVMAGREYHVGTDRYFTELASPAESLSLPKGALTYAMTDPTHAINTGVENGIVLLSPEESAKALPHYPGFGVKREPLEI